MKKTFLTIGIILLLLISFSISNIKKVKIGPNYVKSMWFVYQDQSSWITSYKIVPGADPKSFVEVTKEGSYDSYGKDKNAVYYRTEKITGADPKTFSSVPSKYGTSYAKDKRYVYIDGKVIPDADTRTWGEILACSYSKDEKHVFFEDKVVNEADVTTFVVRDNCLGTDNSSVYWREKELKNISSSGFTIIGVGSDGYFRNNQNAYYIKQDYVILLKEAKPFLFQEYPNLRSDPKRSGYDKIFGDGTHFYREGEETKVAKYDI